MKEAREIGARVNAANKFLGHNILTYFRVSVGALKKKYIRRYNRGYDVLGRPIVV